MKRSTIKKITLTCSLFASTLLNAQTFSDNFDSYTAGQKLAQQSGGSWTTWSNAPGGTEDGIVSSANSASAPNSMYFSSTLQNGGPVDQVKNFGVLNTGSFSLEWNMLVETGKAAYFNLQKTATIGQVYALNAYFNDDGTFTIDDGSALNINSTFTHNSWFNFRLDINFNSNSWEVFIDDVSVGSFSNAINQIASIDLFPVDQNTPYSSGFYVDDFQYTVTPYVLPNLNLAANLVSFPETNTLVGNTVSRKVKVRNLGQTSINSFDVTCNYNGIDEVQSFTGLNLASLAEITVNITAPLTLISGSNVLTATISNVNGSVNDGDLSDNVASVTINAVTPAVGKMVVSEEGTGTWCGWCPRGAVYMEKMENSYGDAWVGIAVHNGDIMTNDIYDAGIASFIGGYPSAIVDRGGEIDPSDMEADILQRIAIAPKAYISNTAVWNAATRVLDVTVSAEFLSNASSSYKLACVLTENNVTGTVSGYNQTNYYSSQSQNLDLIGSNGVNWKTLSNPVPAASMVYDYVAREIKPDFNGMENSFPAIVNSGEIHSQTFSFTLPTTWNESNINIVGLLFDPSGKIDNAGKASFDNALLVKQIEKDNFVSIYPNPANNLLNYSYSKGKINQIRVISTDGKVVFDKKVNESFGKIDISSLISGMYIVELISENGLAKEIFIKE